jgi:GT2 family glycosyltransferase
MDADDVSLPDRLFAEAKYLDQHPEVGMVAGQAFFKEREHVYPSPLARWISTPVLLNRLLFEVNPIISSASMVRKSAIMKIGGYAPSFDRWPYAEDYDLAIRLARLFDVIVIPDYVCIYALSTASMSRGHSMDRFIGLCIAKARSVSLAKNPVDITRALVSILRAVEIDVTSRFTKDMFSSYLLNVQTLESKV